MTTCLAVRSALTQKGMLGGWTRLIQLPRLFLSLSLFPLEERESEPGIRLLFVNITPRVPSSAEVSSRVTIVFSCVLLVDRCNTATMKYN